MKQRGAKLPPSDVIGVRYRTLCIPNDDTWSELVTGVLLQLTYKYYYDSTKTSEEKEPVVQRARNMVFEYLQQSCQPESGICQAIIDALSQSGGDMELFIAKLAIIIAQDCTQLVVDQLLALVYDFAGRIVREIGVFTDDTEASAWFAGYGVEFVPELFRQVGDDLERSLDNGNTWAVVYDGASAPPIADVVAVEGANADAAWNAATRILTLTLPRGSDGADGADGAPGVNGAKGDKGDKGDAGTVTNSEPADTTEPNNNDTRCGVALRVAGGVFDVYDDNVVGAANSATQAAAVGAILTTIGTYATGLGFAAQLIIGGVVNALAANLIALGSASAANALNNAERDKARANLYCALKNAGVNNISQSVIDSWKSGNNTGDNALNTTGASLLNNTIDSMGVGLLKQTGLVGALEPSATCDAAYDCGDDPLTCGQTKAWDWQVDGTAGWSTIPLSDQRAYTNSPNLSGVLFSVNNGRITAPGYASSPNASGVTIGGRYVFAQPCRVTQFSIRTRAAGQFLQWQVRTFNAAGTQLSVHTGAPGVNPNYVTATQNINVASVARIDVVVTGSQTLELQQFLFVTSAS